MKLQIPPIGRKLAMMVNFGNEAPPELAVHGNIFAQLLLDGMKSIAFRREADVSIYEAERNWIGEPKDLALMLAGGIIPVPHDTFEISRIETIYRYVFSEILYGPSGQEARFPKDGTVPEVGWDKASAGRFTLKLVSFGEYYWDESQSFDSDSIQFS